MPENQKTPPLRKPTPILPPEIEPNTPKKRPTTLYGVIAVLSALAVVSALLYVRTTTAPQEISTKTESHETQPRESKTPPETESGSPPSQPALGTSETPEKLKKTATAAVTPETLWGITVRKIDAELAKQFGIDEKERGVVITGIADDSPAAKAGLQAGDVIKEINRQVIYDDRDYKRIMDRIKKDVILLLRLRRGADTFHAAFSAVPSNKQPPDGETESESR